MVLMVKMKLFNVVYDDDMKDVDIISVPNCAALRIKEITQEFLRWLPHAREEIYWTTVNGNRCSVCETAGFVSWLNNNYCECKSEATIVEEHVNYNDNYDIIEF